VCSSYENTLPQTDLAQKGIPEFAQESSLFVEFVVMGVSRILGSWKWWICPGRDYEQFLTFFVLDNRRNGLAIIQPHILGSSVLFARSTFIGVCNSLAHALLVQPPFFEALEYVLRPKDGLAHASIVVKC
jgi:hypothetical protein